MSNIQTREELSGFLRRWLSNNPSWSVDYSDRRNPRRKSAQEVSLSILSAMETEDVRLAQWFQTPEGELVLWGARQALGPYAGADLGLLIEAVTLAAQAKNKNQKILAGIFIAIVAFLAAGIIKEVFTY